jgi:hypothetical protein
MSNKDIMGDWSTGEWAIHLEDELMRRNQYRSWSGDYRVWSQVTVSEPATSGWSQVCPKCQRRFEVEKFIANCLCDECRAKKQEEV